jgi:ThiF family
MFSSQNTTCKPINRLFDCISNYYYYFLVFQGWGVRNIDILDNSKVSHSNPVRQSLFTYEDCVKGLSKSVAAAANLKKIFPSVVSQ